MKWIKYSVFQNTINTGTESAPVYEDILLPKKVGYSEANLALAQEEAYQGKYVIVEEEGEEALGTEPLPVEFGGTGKNSIISGNFLIGNGTGPMQEKTPKEVLSLIGASGRKIMLKTYGGTGDAGEENAVKITFPSGYEPRLILIYSTFSASNFTWIKNPRKEDAYLEDNVGFLYASGSSKVACTANVQLVKESETQFYFKIWHDKDGYAQLNVGGEYYTVFALCQPVEKEDAS